MQQSTSSDSNVNEVRQLLLDRAEIGLKKYGVTTDRDDLNVVDWLVHAREEVLDLSLYLTRVIKEVKKLQERYTDDLK
jgi:hypothetical protein